MLFAALFGAVMSSLDSMLNSASTIFTMDLYKSPRTPPASAVKGLIIGAPVYGILLWALPDVAFLNHMAFTFLIIVATMTLITWVRPLAEPHTFEGGSDMDLSPDPLAKFLGYGVLVAIAALYVIFR